MNQLTIVASNRDRFDLNSNSTKWFLKSLENQTLKNFDLIIADGGSKNVDEIKDYAKSSSLNMFVAEFKLGEKFERARLNNVGIRNSKTPYCMSTDVDMFFATNFVETIVSKLSSKVFIESRTLCWKRGVANKIYSGELDPIKDIDLCKRGRILKRSSAGGCACAHIDQWTRVKAYNEAMVGWGSEDVELLKRMKLSGARILWLGEKKDREDVMVFHQPHPKPNLKDDLVCQKQNLRVFRSSQQELVNVNGWGGIVEIWK